jgi:hypothetical protein
MGLAIPSQIVALLTFPGVVLHEVIEQLFCRWLGVAVLDVCYFRFGNPAGYITHEPKLQLRKSLWIALGPFLVNSLLGALVAFPAILTAWEFRVSTTPSYILAWLGISIAAHAVPNPDSAATLWHAARSPECSLLIRVLAAPVAGFALIVSAGRVVGFDLLYGAAIVTAPTALLLFLLR